MPRQRHCQPCSMRSTPLEPQICSSPRLGVSECASWPRQVNQQQRLGARRYRCMMLSVARTTGHGRVNLGGAVAFVVPDFEPLVGGTSRQVGYMARGLAARGHQVIVVTRRPERWLPRKEVLGGLPVIRLGPAGRGAAADKAALLATACWLVRHRRSLAVVQILMQADLASAARLAGVVDRTCVTWAGLGDATDLLAPTTRGLLHRSQWRYRRAALAHVRHVALSAPIGEELRGHGESVAAQIPVPVDLDDFRPPSPHERSIARAAVQATDDEFVIVYVGHLRALKAIDRLVAAFVRFVGEGRPGRLILVGGSRGSADDTETQLRLQVRAAGVNDRVRFTGSVPDVRPLLWAADAFVLPSEREGMPNTLLEAMGCGVACVAPASAGGDVLLSGGAGLVPRSNDPSALFEALVALADDVDLGRTLVAAALGRVGEFSVEHVIDQYEHLYCQATPR